MRYSRLTDLCSGRSYASVRDFGATLLSSGTGPVHDMRFLRFFAWGYQADPGRQSQVETRQASLESNGSTRILPQPARRIA